MCSSLELDGESGGFKRSLGLGDIAFLARPLSVDNGCPYLDSQNECREH